MIKQISLSKRMILISKLTLLFFFGTSILTLSGSSKTEIDVSAYKSEPILVYNSIQSSGISYRAFEQAMAAYKSMIHSGRIKNDSLITIVDFTKPSTDRRLFIINIKNMSLLTSEWVAHGKNTGLLYAENFSNKIHSLKSSLGAFITLDTYTGKHGNSLQIDGLEKGLNDNAKNRAVVIHGASYVSEEYIKNHGRLGRSFGCPAIRQEVSDQIINTIKGGTFVYLYHKQIDS